MEVYKVSKIRMHGISETVIGTKPVKLGKANSVFENKVFVEYVLIFEIFIKK